MGNETFRLFAVPSFIEGTARVVDLGATLEFYNEDDTSNEADMKSILSDWKATGKDMAIGAKNNINFPHNSKIIK